MSVETICLGCRDDRFKHQCLVGDLRPGVMGGWYCICENKKCKKQVKDYRKRIASLPHEY